MKFSKQLWFTKQHIVNEINVLQKLNEFVTTLSLPEVEACVDAYLCHQTVGETLTSAAQFVARVHLLHPHDFKRHRAVFEMQQIPIEKLQAVPASFEIKKSNWVVPEKLQKVKEWLVQACLRHKGFLEKSKMFKDFDSGRISGLISEYKDFLRLKKENPGTIVVPTISQDLIWHTHQLDNSKYETEVLARAGEFLNHDDAIPEEILKEKFEETKTLWKNSKRPWISKIAFLSAIALCMVGMVAFGFFYLHSPIASVKELHSQAKHSFHHIGHGYCRATCSGTVKQCKADHDWRDYCVEFEHQCQETCSTDPNCYGYSFSNSPSFDSMYHGKDARDCGRFGFNSGGPGRCVIMDKMPKGYRITQTTSDRAEYACHCKARNNVCIGEEYKGMSPWHWLWIGPLILIGVCSFCYCIKNCESSGGGYRSYNRSSGGGCGGGGCGGGGCGGGGCGGGGCGGGGCGG